MFRQLEGQYGIKKRKMRNHSKKFKLLVIKQILEEGKGYREVGREYKFSHSVIQRWVKLYLEEGEDSVKDTPNKDSTASFN